MGRASTLGRPLGPGILAGLNQAGTNYQGLYHDRKIPALLMEQMVGYNAKLGRVPTVGDRIRFGAELARALAAAVSVRTDARRRG